MTFIKSGITVSQTFATVESNALKIDTVNESDEGLYTIERIKGSDVESFFLSMCFLKTPTNDIWNDSSQLILYKDTATTLSGSPGDSPEEINIIELFDFEMTTIS